MGDPGSTVVLCVECQNGVIGGESILPALAEDCGDLVERLAGLLTGARAAGVGVVHATLEGLYPGADPGPARIWRVSAPATAGWAPGVSATRVISDLLADSDMVVPRRHGLFPTSATELIPVLCGLAVKTVVLTGVSLNLALPHTAGDLVEAGFQLVVPRDAVVGTPVGYGEQVLKNTMAMLGQLTTIEALLAHWSATPAAVESERHG
ncbi:isochorismatase family protein [Mycobacterium hodleri]|uniref:Isochorismatase family protein n=1 Tax=Mycolicibacterium hodleri TaxID=49897 RepID=A0A502EJU4_9MYCO|nr:isochorismatase family protein [Mycolicibacterium hodleri]